MRLPKKSPPILPSGGLWWRFSAYEIKDGYVRPAPGAKLEHFDPWEAYSEVREGLRGVRIGSKTGDTPYADFFAVLEKLSGTTDFRNPSEATQRAITEVCAKWGLLGLLTHRTSYVRFAARWIVSNPDAGVSERLMLPSALSFTRRPDRWEPRREWIFDGGRVRPVVGAATKVQEEQLVQDADLVKGSPDAFAHVLESEDSFRWTVEPLETTWCRYFPDVSEAEHRWNEYPLPLSEEFWLAYAEPVADFVEAIRTLHWDAQRLALTLQAKSKLSGQDARDSATANYSLAAMVAQTSPFPSLEPPPKARFVQYWASPSLLGSLAQMVQFDLADNKLLRCRRCGRVFASAAWQAAYCSTRCKNAANQQIFRERKKKQKEVKRGKKTRKR